MRKRPLLMIACVFLTGICYKCFGGIHWILLSSVLLIYGTWPFIRKKQLWKVLVAGLFTGVFFLWGGFRLEQEEAFKSRYLSELQDGDKITIQGEIYYKEQKTYQIHYYLRNTYISISNQAIPCNQVIAYMSQDLYPIGTTIIAEGTVAFFPDARNEGNFSSRDFYASQKIDFAVEKLQFQKTIEPVSYWQEWLYQFRSNLKDSILAGMGEREGGVLAGMFLGDKSALNSEVKEAYKDMGLSHTLAISGLHISIFASGIYGFLRKRGMGYGGAGIFSFLFLIAYASMTGNGVSTQRAVGMFLITIIGAVFGKNPDLLNSLGAMILCLLGENPFLLHYAGFQFSFVAVISIGIVQEVKWKRKLLRVEDGKHRKRIFSPGGNKENEVAAKFRQKIVDAIVVSGFIQLGTLPLTAYHYFEVPVYSIVLNVVLLPLMSYLLPFGALGALIGLFWQFPAKIILLPCRAILWLYEASCNLMLKLPFSQWITGRPMVEDLVIYYVILFIGILFWYYGKKKCLYYLANGAAVCFCLFCSAHLKPQISVLDVGQGDGIFLQSVSGISMFIDGGSTDVKQLGTYRILPFLKSKGVRKIHYWFISHADTDHISGMLEVLESGYEVENIVLAEHIPRDEAWGNIVELAEASDCEILYLDQGDKLYLGAERDQREEAITCLFAGVAGGEDRNASSLVLLWKFGDFSGLFTGDVSAQEEAKILQKYSLEEVDFYKVAHHGSKYSNSEGLLDMLKPKIAVISCGEDNSYGHPHDEVLKRLEEVGSEVWVTPECGEITVEIGAERRGQSWLSLD